MKRMLVILCSVTAAAVRAQEPADAVLQECERTYAAMHSYSDASIASFRNPDGSSGARVEFKIWFARPKFVRIDATTHSTLEAAPRREVMWFDGEMARMWATDSPVSTRSSVQLAGSKMFGTYAYHIPTLLEASFGGPQRLNQLSEAELAGDETIDDVECNHIRGKWMNDPYDVWIGKSDRLVRKIVANYSGYVMEEIHREMKVNEPIDAHVFHFAPEEETGAPLKKETLPRLPGEHRRAEKPNE